ncbi:unnamed protein product [Closterium sp. NIES-65]|nr:unnamed protein product [Closterium sp. NIES-65]
MASAPPVRAEPWTPPLPAKPALPPSAPPPSAQPAPPLPFHLWRRRQQRRVRSAFSAASGARKQWDAASADGLRAATAVVNRLVQLKQLPGKDLGAVGGMEGIVERAAEKIRRIMEAWQERDMYPDEPIFTALRLSVFGSLPFAAVPHRLVPYSCSYLPLLISPPLAPCQLYALSLMQASFVIKHTHIFSQSLLTHPPPHTSPSAQISLLTRASERWAGDVAAMFRRELLVKHHYHLTVPPSPLPHASLFLMHPSPPHQRLILSSLNSAVRHEAATTTTARTTTTTPNTSLTSQSPLKHPLNIPPLCLPCAASPPATVPAPKADATLDASALAVEEGASPGETVETGGGRLEAAGAAGTTGAGRAATSRDEDGRETPAATEEEAASEAAAEGEAPGCLQGEGIGTGGGDMETGIGGERGAGGNGGRGQGGSGMLEGQNGLKGQAWAEGRGLSHGLSAAEGCEWAVVQQQLEQSGLLARSPTPQQLQVCLVAWLVEMHIDSRCLSSIFAAVDEEVKSVAA